MIKATYEMSEADKQMIADFKIKILDEYSQFLETVKNYTKQELFEKAKKIAFMQSMRDYLVDNFDLSLRQIYELLNQPNFLNQCYRAYKRNCDPYGFFDYPPIEIIRLAMQDDNF